MSVEPRTHETVSEAQTYDLERVAGGTFVFEPIEEYRESLGRTTQIGKRLVGVAGVQDWDAIRTELVRRGHGAGLLHQLEEYELAEVA